MDFKDLIAYIQKILDTFFGVLPQIQKQTLESVLNRTQQLELSGDRIRISAENLKRLAEVQSSLRKILLSDNYMKAVSGYAKAYNEVTKLQHSYFQTIEANYGGPALAKEMMKIAKENVVSQLTETGLMANVADPVKEVIRRAITSGSSYATLQEQLNEVLAGEEGGILERYTKQISTDAINQYSRQYSQLASADLGLEWFRYAGSNIKTTRPFCLACTDRKYFHISEVPALLRGDFPEFKKYDGKIYERTKLPQGMYPETDVTNFPTLLGGYNCGHQYRPISDKQVPDDIKQRVYESAEYKAWKGADAKKDTGTVPGKEKKVSGKEKDENKLKSVIGVSDKRKKALKSGISPDSHTDITQYPGGGLSAVHKRADKGEDFKENVASVELYANLLGSVAEVAEHVKIPGVKNPELRINGFKADNKKPNHSDYSKGTLPYKSISSAISNGAKSAIKQKAIPVIILEKRYNLEDVIKGVKYGFDAKGKDGAQVNEIHLRYRNEGITTIIRQEFIDGEYVEKIKEGYKNPL